MKITVTGCFIEMDGEGVAPSRSMTLAQYAQHARDPAFVAAIPQVTRDAIAAATLQEAAAAAAAKK